MMVRLNAIMSLTAIVLALFALYQGHDGFDNPGFAVFSTGVLAIFIALGVRFSRAFEHALLSFIGGDETFAFWYGVAFACSGFLAVGLINGRAAEMIGRDFPMTFFIFSVLALGLAAFYSTAKISARQTGTNIWRGLLEAIPVIGIPFALRSRSVAA